MKTNTISFNGKNQKAPPFFQTQPVHSDIFYMKKKFSPSSYLFKPESQNKSIPNIILNTFPANQNNSADSLSNDKKASLLKSPANLIFESTKKYTKNSNAIQFEKISKRLPKDIFLKKSSLSKRPNASQLKEIFNEKPKKSQQNNDSSNKFFFVFFYSF